jgi:energy-coupling factor transporter transmembrane protein EcfT
VLLSLFQRLFARLLEQSETIAAAMAARGFAGPEQHRLYLTQPERSSAFANAAALAALAAVTSAVLRWG